MIIFLLWWFVGVLLMAVASLKRRYPSWQWVTVFTLLWPLLPLMVFVTVMVLPRLKETP